MAYLALSCNFKGSYASLWAYAIKLKAIVTSVKSVTTFAMIWQFAQ